MHPKNSKQVESLLLEMYNDLDKSNNNQVFEGFEKAIEKVMQNPISKEFIKYDTEEYRAVDVLAQRRAFFKIYTEHDTVFFVWLNPEDFPHDSSKGENDPCYKEFKRLLKNNKLETYEPEVVKEPEFNFWGQFRKDQFIHTNLKSSKSFSQASLQLISREDSEYEIAHIDEATHYNSDSLPLLLIKVAEKAKAEKINLISFVGSERDCDYRLSVAKALKTAGFTYVSTEAIGDLYRLAA
jgi:hypothetical protein